MGKYFGSTPGNQSNVGPSGCGKVVSQGAFAWDEIGDACWGASGVRIRIEDTMDSYHSGFERINFWMSQDATVCPTCNVFGLEGPIA